jgi:hypothetical protein
LRGKEADARSDLFGFGTVLYEMISGQHAFKGDSPAETLSAILKEEPPELTATNVNAPPALDRIVRHCLEKNPAERFQSAHDLAFNLEALTGISKVATDIQTPSARRRAWLLPGLVVVLALALGAAFLLGRTTRAPYKPEFHQVTFLAGRFTARGSRVMGPQSCTAPPGKASPVRYSRRGTATLSHPRWPTRP